MRYVDSVIRLPRGEIVLHLMSLPLGVAKDVLRTNTLFTPGSFGNGSSSSSLGYC